MNDQTCKQDAGKPQIHLVPPEIMTAIANVRKMGNQKYGDSDSWKRVEPTRYIDAIMRHMLKCFKNPWATDAESEMPHIWHVATNIAFLCAMYERSQDDSTTVNTNLSREITYRTSGTSTRHNP